MQTTERVAFDAQLRVLFGGWPKTMLTEERKDAYWRGLQKIHLSTFARIVDHALGPDGPKDLPSTSAIWELSKTIGRVSYQATPIDARVEADRLSEYGRVLDEVVLMRAQVPMHPSLASEHRRPKVAQEWSAWHATHPEHAPRYARLADKFRAMGGYA